MRTASRSAFSNTKDEPAQGVSLLFEALGGLIALSLIGGTVLWGIGVLLVEEQLVSRSMTWWWFVRMAGLLHAFRSVIGVYRQR